MASVTQVLSSLNWKSLISSGITSGIKGVVTDAGEYGLAWAVDSMFGLEVGKPGKQDEKQQLITTLGSINTEIAAINQSLAAVASAVKSLGNEISVDFHKTLNAIQGETTMSNNNAIASFWQTLGTDITNTTGNPNANPPVPPVPLPAGTTATFAADVVQPGSNGVTFAIDQITSNLLPYSASLPGLLDNGVTILISYVQQGTPLTTAYAWLEQCFLQNVYYLFQGHSLMIAAQIRNAWVPGAPASGQTGAQTVAMNYLNGTAAPNLTSVTQMFIQSVHRLILSQYQAPNANNTGFLPFIGQSDADAILSRANLIAWLINRSNTEKDGAAAPANPGIVVTAYYRPSQIAGGNAPALQPTGYPASSGKPFKLEYGYAGNWYKVVDYADANCSQILDYQSSSIVIADYQWANPAPAVGKPVAGTGVLANIVPGYYDITTLDPVSAASATTVIYGYATDLSALQNLYWNTLPDWSLTQAPNDIEYCTYTPGGTTSGSSRGVSSYLIVTGQYKNDPLTFNSNLRRNASYNGPTSANLLVAIDAQANLTCNSYSESSGPVIPLNMNTSATFANQQIPNSAQQIDNPTSNSGGSGTTPSISQSIQTVQSFSVAQNQNLQLAFNTSGTAQQQDWYKDYDNHAAQTAGSAGFTIASVSLAWPQPQPPPLSTSTG